MSRPERGAIEGGGTQDEHVDLHHRGEMDDVEAGAPPDRVVDHVAVDVVLRLQSLHERRHMRGVQIRDEIDVERRTGNPERGAGDGTAHAVDHAERLERVRDRIEGGPELVGHRRDAR